MIRTRVCIFCGKEFSYEVGRGRDKWLCSKQCSNSRALKRIKDKLNNGSHKVCKVEGCEKQANRSGAGLCEAHYMRLRRRGTVDLKSWPQKTFNQAGYVKIKAKSHPLSDATGTIYEHRMVYHKYFGEGPFSCHWCGKTVTWFNMHIDHLDDNVTNNDIDNLVASCPKCNMKRGSHKMVSHQRAKGRLLTHNGETMCVSEWARRLGMAHSSIQARLNAGWTIERALTEPRGKTGPKDRTGKRRRG